MSFATEGFVQFGKGEGVIAMDFGGEKVEMPYSAVFYLNRARTVALAETSDPEGGEAKVLFLSRTAAQEVMTFGGQRTGAAPVDGVLLNTVASTDREALLTAHLQAVGGQALVDEAGLKQAVESAPRRSAELTMKLMAQLMAAFS